MFWKFLFVIAAILFFVLDTVAFNIPNSQISSLDSFAGIFLEVMLVIVFGIFYALGWKKQMFSLKVINKAIAVFGIGMFTYLAWMVFGTYKEVVVSLPNPTFAMIVSIVASLIILLITNLFFIPFYIGLCEYKKQIQDLTIVDKPYWKLFAFLCIPPLLAFVCAALLKNNLLQYNWCDYFVIISGIYETLLLIAFAWNVKIFNKMFWQITAIPYIVLTCLTPFCMSEAFHNDFQIKELLTGDIVSLITSILIFIAYIYILFKYCFAKQEG